jgi:outer membrane receptor protein involved in Fe transport
VVKLPGAAALGALAALFGALEVRAQDAPSPASTSAEQAEAQPIEVTIEGDKAPPGAVSLGRKQIQEMPGVLADPYRAIEVEPGVTPLTSGVPFYFVRGAPPGNVGYFFDGIQVPMLFHVGAGPGVIPSALVQRVELHLGPYPASFGRMAGAIVDAESAPARSDWRGEGVMRVVDVGGLVEGRCRTAPAACSRAATTRSARRSSPRWCPRWTSRIGTIRRAGRSR